MSWPTGEMPRIVAERGSLGGVGITKLRQDSTTRK